VVCVIRLYFHAITFIIYRGKDFRTTFAEIGSIRSLIPNSVKILALTATATRETLDCVLDSLSLEDPAIIGMPPNRPNIRYTIEHPIGILDFSQKITDELMAKRIEMPKTVVFCRTLQNCANIFNVVKKRLGKNITEPPGALYDGIVHFRLVDVFTAVSSAEMREVLLKEFCKAGSRLRLLIATTAFGMGVDCPDIDRVVNWGCPNTLEELVQETGRGGRDGRRVEAILYPTRFGKNVSKEMRNYVGNTRICRKRKLFQTFLFNDMKQDAAEMMKACQCCDLCAKLCSCIDCENSCN